MTISAVFLDRDGVINEYLPGAYVRSPGELRVIPGVATAIKRLNAAGLPVVVISNQQGVGKGLMTAADLLAVEQAIQGRLKEEAGGRLDKCYYCTDLDSAKSPRRKPLPGMLIEAAADLGVDLRESVMIGDSATDVAAGYAAGVGATLLILSGSIENYAVGDMKPAPDHVFSNLSAAVDWVLEARAQ